MHRVIALNGVPESAATNKPVDLSRTVHEWEFKQRATGSSIERPAQPAQSTQLPQPPAFDSKATAEAHWATHSSISLVSCEETQLPARILQANIEDAVTQQYNPASTRIPLASSLADLASLDRALESVGAFATQQRAAMPTYLPEPAPAPEPERIPPAAVLPAPLHPQPRMLLVPASVVWTVLTVFSLCAVALAVLAIAVLLRGDLF